MTTRLSTRLLIALFPIILVAFAAVGYAVYSHINRYLAASLESQIDRALEQTSRQWQNRIDTLRSNAQLFASSDLIESYAAARDRGEREGMLQPDLLRMFSRIQQAYPDYHKIRFVLPDGTEDTRVSSDYAPNATVDESGSAWFQAIEHDALIDGEAEIIKFIWDQDNGDPVLLAGRSIAVADARNPMGRNELHLAGYLTISASVDDFAEAMSSQRVGQSGRIVLIDSEGNPLGTQSATLSADLLQRLALHSEESRESVHSGENAHEAQDARAYEAEHEAAQIHETDDGLEAEDEHGDSEEHAAEDVHEDEYARAHKEEHEQLEEHEQHEHGHALHIGDDSLFERHVNLQGGISAHALVPDSEFAALRRTLAMQIVMITIVALLIVSGLFFAALRRLVVKPLEQLALAARNLGEGRSDIVLEDWHQDEIGVLAVAFNDMRAKLSATMHELQSSHDQITKLAYTDSLTGLPNRLAVSSLINQSLQAHSADDVSALLFLDLDGFKRINDTLGHEAGDKLLVAVSERLRQCTEAFGPDVPVGRLGGDEFTILLPGAEEVDAVAMADRILVTLRDPVTLGKREVVVGSSIGLAMYPRDASNAAALLKCADVAMYDAKRRGPNNRQIYGRAMQVGLEQRMELEAELRLAVHNDLLTLDYQPQYTLVDNAIAGCEALLRWRHPQLGLVSPADFIPVAEASDLIGEIGAWVLDEACRQWREWADAGMFLPRIAVNISQKQFASCDIDTLVATTLARHAVPPDVLELELTESCMMDVGTDVVSVLEKVRQTGVRVAMDDFGTGYSSLAALTRLPIDTLKIDRSFVTGIYRDSPNEKVVSAILSLARSLHLEIVAEGVEAEAEMDYLRENACDIVQGYLLSRPLSVPQVEALLAVDYPAVATSNRAA